MPTSAECDCFCSGALLWPVTSFFNSIKCEQIWRESRGEPPPLLSSPLSLPSSPSSCKSPSMFVCSSETDPLGRGSAVWREQDKHTISNPHSPRAIRYSIYKNSGTTLFVQLLCFFCWFSLLHQTIHFIAHVRTVLLCFYICCAPAELLRVQTSQFMSVKSEIPWSFKYDLSVRCADCTTSPGWWALQWH